MLTYIIYIISQNCNFVQHIFVLTFLESQQSVKVFPDLQEVIYK